jgi:hypothetical protein
VSSTPGPQLGPEPDAAGVELSVHSARKDGREVVRLRSVDQGGSCVIECEVYPLSGLRVEPLHAGPYHFPSRSEADAFVNEAVLALSYLGCEVSRFGA